MSEPCFQIKDLSRSYGRKIVLDKLSISLAPGLFYGLIGPNGSGKTTLLNHLLGSSTPQDGTIFFKGHNIASYPKRDLAKQLALVPQNFMINFEFTVFELVMMGRHPYIPRFGSPNSKDINVVEEAMEAMDISEFKGRLITELSGGEMQRVIVSRALAQGTEVLILDEATSNLDIQHTIQIFKVLKEKTAKGGTVIAAIHDLNLAAAYCDQIIILNDANIRGCGPTAEILTEELLLNVFQVEGKIGLDKYSNTHQIRFKYQ